MDSRVVTNPEALFESFLELAAPVNDDPAAILQTYPEDVDKDTLKQAPIFCYSCKPEKGAVQHFSFVLTDGNGKYRFGFCRYPPDASCCLCFISYLPWFEFFYNILDKVAELRHDGQGELVLPVLKALLSTAMPTPGERFMVIPEGLQSGQAFSFQTPDPQKLPSIPESHNLTEYITNIDPVYILHLFAAMLFERRIIITSSKLSLISACIHGAASLLYPLNWQHIFIPVMPARLSDYCCAPMPFLVGVHSSVMAKIRKMPLDEVVVLDADANQLEIYHDDLGLIPADVVGPLKDTLKKHTSALDDTVAKAFLDAFVFLIGGYRDALRFREGEQIKFDAMAFIESRPKQMQPFLQKVLHLQQFQQFMMERLHRLNQGQGLRDVFENAITCSSQDSTNYLNKYAQWVKSKTKKGFSEISSITTAQVLPSMKTAISHIHSRTKKGVKGLKHFMNDEKSGPSQGMTIGSPHLASRTSISVNELISSLPADSTLRKQAQIQQRPKRPPPLVRPYSEYRATRPTPSTASGDGSSIGSRTGSSAPIDSPLLSECELFENKVPESSSLTLEVSSRVVGGGQSGQLSDRSPSPGQESNDLDVEVPVVDDLLGLSVASIPSRSHVTTLARELFLNFDSVADDISMDSQPIQSTHSPHSATSQGAYPAIATASSTVLEPSIGEALSPTSSFDPFHSPSHVQYSSASAGDKNLQQRAGSLPGIVDSESLDDFSALARERSSTVHSSAQMPSSAMQIQDPWQISGASSLGNGSISSQPSFVPRHPSPSVARSTVAADPNTPHPTSGPVSRAPQFTAMSRSSSVVSPAHRNSVAASSRGMPTPFDGLIDQGCVTTSSLPAADMMRLSQQSSSAANSVPSLLGSTSSQSLVEGAGRRPGPAVKPFRSSTRRNGGSGGGVRDHEGAPVSRGVGLEFDPLA